MKKIATCALCLALAACHGDGWLMPSIQNDLRHGYETQVLDPSISLHFAQRPNEVAVYEGSNRGTFVSNKKANSFWRSSDLGCRRAFHSALISLQNRAKLEGGDSVVNIHSYYKKNPEYSATGYRCWDNYLMSGVALRGTVVKRNSSLIRR